MRRRGVQLGLIAAVQVLGMAMWFSASAVVPSLQSEWGISEVAAVWLTAAVQLGFVLGAVISALLNLPDRFAPQRLAACAALGAAVTTAAVPLLADGLATAVLLRLAVGMFLAGVYPVGMKLMASWFGSAGRGFALGVLVGALTLGSSLPHLVNGLADLEWRGVLYVSAAIGVAAAVLAVSLVRPGPLLGAAARHRPRYVLEMFRERGPLLANLGYFGHMWELYALWTWLPSFLAASAGLSSTEVGVTAFLVIGVAGVAGCLLGGWASDRFGRPPAARIALLISGACCLAAPLIFIAPWPVQLAVLLLWGLAVIADSGVFSTVLSEVADQRYVGTALTAQTALGFLLTVVTINIVPIMANIVGWQYAFLVLAPGPLLGAVAMRALRDGTSAAGVASQPTQN
ncbi:sugar phosphate permease [Tamaricihabitans halophyticus]|uniref:Sugar phosphate permease n=1 Tax=Tamaricihabitans halophyticus TaxID=1262583 RepID=A0A4V2SUP0_9PSEU|nr:MFS transporter [Tamaricihabitans halophyticus]TCP55336.1 sugar phosphate permease [Tamaricihabitans halophyticus]